MNSLSYKGYVGSVETDFDDNVLFGKLLYIRDLVNYEGETVAELKAAFHEAVDSYLADCEKSGKQPDHPFKGSFNVRLKPELHKELAVAAQNQRMSLNLYVGRVLSKHQKLMRERDLSVEESSHWFKVASRDLVQKNVHVASLRMRGSSTTEVVFLVGRSPTKPIGQVRPTSSEPAESKGKSFIMTDDRYGGGLVQ